jgi:hypothetical protein
MDDIPTVVPGEYVFDEDKLTIPAEHVALVRSGLIAELRSAADEIGTVAEFAARETRYARFRWKAAFAHFDDARALLDVVGWHVDRKPRDVEVDLRAHHNALLAALHMQVEAERGHAESLPEDQRDQANAHMAALSDLIEQAEEWL